MTITKNFPVLGLLACGLLLAGSEGPPEPAPGRPREEHRVVVTARPEIRNENGYSLLILPPVAGRPIEVAFDPKYSTWCRNLPPDKALTFTLWQTRRVDRSRAGGDGDPSWWYCSIESIRDGAGVLYDAAICPQHGTRMQRAEIDISYGLPMREFLDAMAEFSGGPGFVLGGCVVGPETTTMGYKCAECVAAYERWEKKWVAEREERIRQPKPGTP